MIGFIWSSADARLAPPSNSRATANVDNNVFFTAIIS